MNKKPYNIDVAVLLIFFNRPGCFSKVFEQVKKARPSKLFLYQDGAREGNEKDAIGVAKCREIALDIDWECELHTKFQEKNYGCDPSGYIARKWAFEHVEKCIILEDDCVASQSFFPFCKELLDKYADDQRINMICGMNNLESWESPYSYLFTETGSICGVATWKRIVDEWDPTYSILDNQYYVSKLKYLFENQKFNLRKRLVTWKYNKNSGIEFHETIGGITQCANYRINIVSSKNLISNIGNSPEGGTHSAVDVSVIPKGLRKIFTMSKYEIPVPLKHPDYVINDIEFQKKLFRVMGIGHPLVRIYRNVEKLFLMAKHQGFTSVLKKLKGKMGK